MFNKLKQKVGEFARQVTAPPVEKPAVETFKELWQMVQDEHNALLQKKVNLDDPKLLHKTYIPDNLDALVSILIREDIGSIKDTNERARDMGRKDEHGNGPLKACLEFTLENRVFIDLCAKGLADRPPGMMALILVTVHQIIDKVHHPLLPYKTAHQPLCQLIRVCAEVGNDKAKDRLVALLKTLWSKMRKDPSQLTFFYTPASNTQVERLDMFVALLPFILLETDTGNRARYAVMAATSICDAHLMEYIANQTTFCTSIAEGLCRSFNRVMQALAARDDDRSNKLGTAEAAEVALGYLSLVWRFANMASIPCTSIGIDVSADWTSSRHRVHAKSRKDTETNDDDEEEGASEDVSGDRSFEVLSQKIVQTIHNSFFLDMVAKCLLETSEATQKNAMLAVCTLLDSMLNSGQELKSPLHWALITLLISTDVDADFRPIEDIIQEYSVEDENEATGDMCKRLQPKLLLQLDSLAPHVSTAALKLFSSLLELNDPRILHCLILRQLFPGAHLRLSSQDGPSSASHGLEAIDRFQTPTKSSSNSTIAKHLNTPMSPNRAKGGTAVEFLGQYPGSPKPPAVATIKQRKSVNVQDHKDLIAFESYLTDGQLHAAAKIAAFTSTASAAHAKFASPAKPKRKGRGPNLQSPEEIWNTVRGDETESFSEGMFLTLILNKLERMLDSSFEENLILTGILSMLCQCPHRILHAYLFQEEISLADFLLAREGESFRGPVVQVSIEGLELYLAPKEGTRSLSSVLAGVWKESRDRLEHYQLDPEFELLQRKVKDHLGLEGVAATATKVDDNPNSTSQTLPSFSTTSLLFGSAPPSPPRAPAQQRSRTTSSVSLVDLQSSVDGPKVKFIQALVVLEEFMKELATTLQAKQNLAILQQEFC